jgi:hypothetical protein
MAEEPDRSRGVADDATRLRRQSRELAHRRARLRSQLNRTATDIARTEMQIADTLDQVAAGRPGDAERLHDRAQAARDFARREAAFGAAGEAGDDPPDGQPGRADP